jgi:solute carrier family 25 phosphate transporter 23/24/25/41
MDRALERKVPFAEAQALLNRLDSNNNGSVEYEELLYGTLLSAGSIWKVLEAESLYYFLPKTNKNPSLRIFLAGFIAGAASRSLTAPFDRASILMRAGGSSLARSTVFGTLAAMAKEGGLKSWWSGNGLLCLTVAPESAFMYTSYNALRPLMSNPDEPSLADKLVAGGTAGLAAMTLVYPLYASQARMALAPAGSFASLRDFFSKTFRAEGLVAFGRGYFPSALRAFPSRGLDLMVYQTLKEIFCAPGDTVSIPQSLTFGAIAGIISQSLTMPLLTLRTRMAGQAPSLGRPVLYKSMLDCVQKTVYGDAALGLAAGGVPALYRGLPALLMKMVPCTGIQFCAFELANKFLSRFLD